MDGGTSPEKNDPEARKTVDLRGRRRLTVAQLEKIKATGRHPLDDRLYFTVQRSGTRSYELRYRSPTTGKRRDMTIGAFPLMDPTAARDAAAMARALLDRGIDPLDNRVERQVRAESAAGEATPFTLRIALIQHHDIEARRWKNAKYAEQWLPRMYKAFGPLLDRPLGSITKADVHDRLAALNAASHDSAVKARANLDKLYRRYCGTNGLPDSLNPAASVAGLLPRTQRVEHHPALDWREAPEFVRRLRDCSAWISVRLGFEWLILSGARTDAVTHATWGQIDLADLTWHSDLSEAANKRRGDVPLTPRMLKIIEAMRPHRAAGSDWLFPAMIRRVRSKHRKETGRPPISNEAFRGVVVRMGIPITAHGFRATFKTWAVESEPGRELQVPEAVIEAALGHSEGSAIRAAYTRAAYWDQRIRLARAWHDFLCCDSHE